MIETRHDIGPGLAGLWAEQLGDVERRLVRPANSLDLEQAVESLEQACRDWPALMACVTDKAVWESLALQLGRLERLATEGSEALKAMEVLHSSARGYSESGEPAKSAAGPAKIDCRG